MACTGLIDIGSFVHCPTICTITHSFIANIFRGVINMPTPRDLRKFCFKISVYRVLVPIYPGIGFDAIAGIPARSGY